MKYYVYVLWSDKLRKRYIGMTEDLDHRFSQHNSGGNTSTRNGRPWIVGFSELFDTKVDALSREKYLKSGVGREWMNRTYPQFSRKGRA